MIARDSHVTSLKRHPGAVAWRDLARDWQRWSAAERFGAPMLLAGLAASTMPILWMLAR
ncbi:MAG: hypothetical protein JSR60_14595 [Proteobacteria bacterium]|nr:hypothetical protein [Pseudomonadota bacterium]